MRRPTAQGAGADHLGEPWALPVQESKLSTFLSQDQQWREGDAEVFLSGQITDAQSRMNVMNLLDNGQVSPTALHTVSTWPAATASSIVAAVSG